MSKEHCKIFLDLLNTGREVPASEFAEISRNHTARISQLRRLGWDIRCTFGEDRQTYYRLHGRTDEAVLKTMRNAQSLTPRPLLVTLQSRGNVLVSFVSSIPDAIDNGFRISIPQTMRFAPGDELLVQVCAPEQVTVPAA